MDNTGKVTVELEWEWQVVEAEAGEPYAFPSPLSDAMREHYDGPAVYRWVIGGGMAAKPQTHVGEADDLLRAIGNHRNPPPGQQATARLKKEMTEAMLMGAEIRLETLRVKSLRVDERNYGPEAVRQSAVRQLLKGVVGLSASRGDRKPSAGDLSALF